MKIKGIKDKRIKFECISPGVVFQLEGELSMKIDDVRKYGDGILNAVSLANGVVYFLADHTPIYAYLDAALDLENK